jgi:2-methylcitrate dehydratase PrpD
VAMQSRVSMQVDRALDSSAPALTQARVTIRLNDGRVLTAVAKGARGYPERPASDDELAAKFLACARRVFDDLQANRVLASLRDIEGAPDIRTIAAGWCTT